MDYISYDDMMDKLEARREQLQDKSKFYKGLTSKETVLYDFWWAFNRCDVEETVDYHEKENLESFVALLNKAKELIPEFAVVFKAFHTAQELLKKILKEGQTCSECDGSGIYDDDEDTQYCYNCRDGMVYDYDIDWSRVHDDREQFAELDQFDIQISRDREILEGKLEELFANYDEIVSVPAPKIERPVPTGKPKVKLTGTDGNIFSVMGKARRAMRDHRVPQETIDEMTTKVTSSSDYHQALGIILGYVDAS